MNSKTRRLSAVDASRLFADCGELALERYPLSSDDGGGWHSKYVSLECDPFHHEYIEVTDETVVHNSHGTDVDDYHYEHEKSSKEAARLLSEKYPESASVLRAFEASCQDTLEACSTLVARLLPGCEVSGLLYNSGRSTVLRVRNSDGSEGAIKFGRTTESDWARARTFIHKLKTTGGNSPIVKVEAIAALPIDGAEEGACVTIAQMPLLKAAFRCRRDNREGRYHYIANVDRERRPAARYCAAVAMAEALAAIHALGYAHLDARPENLLMDGEGRILLGDLDGVRPLADQYDGHLRTSLQYRAPELDRRLPYGADVDVFAWGRTVLYLLTSAPPPGQVTQDARITRDMSGSVYLVHDNTGVTLFDSFNYDGILARMAIKAISTDPQERYPDGAALIAALP